MTGCKEGIDDPGLLFDAKLLLIFPLKFCKLLCDNGDGLGESSGPDESSDSAQDESPDRSSYEEKKTKENMKKYSIKKVIMKIIYHWKHAVHKFIQISEV